MNPYLVTPTTPWTKHLDRRSTSTRQNELDSIFDLLSTFGLLHCSLMGLYRTIRFEHPSIATMRLSFPLTTLLVALVALTTLKESHGFSNAPVFVSRTFPSSSSVLHSSTSSDDAAFSSFAATLEEPSSSSSSSTATAERTWKNDLDEVLDPMTAQARRQILLSQLVTSNAEIRQAVEAAIRARKIDPLLTPTAKKWQDGSRAVARQLASDILPALRSSSGRPASILSPPGDLSKVGSRVFSMLQNQLQQSFETLQTDLADPTRIPARVQQQTETLVKEAANVFTDTPVGLKEPEYTIVAQAADYEVREYAAYTVATTNMASAEEKYSSDNVGQTGAAFNSLAAYLFGANSESKAMDMTTPVQTTMTGEMRFYLADSSIPDPVAEDEGSNMYETGNILIQEIPACRLAVRRFTGFVTAGEIARQKESLLAALKLDQVELDVPHGQTVGHVVFQYNPPYTIPVIRRNELAVPVTDENTVASSPLKEEWTATNDDEAMPGADY